MYDKSARVSVNKREEGNKAYSNKNFSAALVCYNKAIAFAPNESENLSLAYANRSAVYFELKKYDECLKSIRLARKHGYPKEKLKVLKEREEKAKELQKDGQSESSENDPMKFFKLSYESNSNIPFIIERLMIKKTDKYGRGIYASHELNPGDVIAIEKPLISIVYNSHDAPYKHCCNCMKSSMMNLIPCTKTAAVMYCSETCRDKILSRVDLPSQMISAGNIINGPKLMAIGIDALGSVSKFESFVTSYKNERLDKTVFDYDLKNPKSKNYKKNLLSCVLSLKYNRFKADVPKYKNLKNGGIVNFANHLAGVIDMNSIGMQYLDMSTYNFTSPSLELHGSAVLAFGSLFNHSCDPNVQRFAVDNKVVFIVCRPIKAGGQLFINYVGDFFNNSKIYERYDQLRRYEFKCECSACVFDYRREKLIQIYKNVDSPFSRPRPKSVENCIKEAQENYQFVEDHGYNILTLHNYERIQRNIDLLAFAAYHATFPY